MDARFDHSPATRSGTPLGRTIEAREFRDVLGHLPTGVVVVAAFGHDGPSGMAANSITSVSLDPPLIAVCPARTSTTWPAIREAGRFCVSVLAEHDEQTSRRFALRGADRFAGVAWHQRVAGPGLDQAVAWIDCELDTEHVAGDHTIALGRVIDVAAAAGERALIFFRGHYGRFVPAERAPAGKDDNETTVLRRLHTGRVER